MYTTVKERRIYKAAIQELINNYGIGTSFTATTKFDGNPQHNFDGSVTHCVIITINGVIYNIEVYEYQGDYTADCWRLDDQNQFELELHNEM